MRDCQRTGEKGTTCGIEYGEDWMGTDRKR